MKKALVIVNTLLFTIFFVTCVFSQAENKKDYALLLDNSGSLRSQLDSVINIGKAISQKIDSNDSVSLFSFESSKLNFGNATVKTILSWNQNDKINDSIDNLYIVSGNTVLYDAIFQMAKAINLKAETEAKDSEKILILITDGEERASEIKLPQLIKYLKDSKIKVFIVGLTTALTINDRYVYSALSSQSRAKSFLTNLAQETNGRVIFPEKGENAANIAEHLLARK